MNNLILRVSIATLIAVSASVGVKDFSTTNSSMLLIPKAKPQVLSVNSNLESQPSSTVSAQVTPIPVTLVTTSPAPVPSSSPTQTARPVVLIQSSTSVTLARQQKVDKLTKFFSNYNSPLTSSAAAYVDSAEKYNVDWKLLPSIAGVESTFGKRMIPNSHNAYGWGGGYIMFASWEEGIEKINKSLSEKYIARGLVTPHQMQRVYSPPSKTWGDKVVYFMNRLDNTQLDF